MIRAQEVQGRSTFEDSRQPLLEIPLGPCYSVPEAAESAPRPWPETQVLWLALKRSKQARGRDISILSSGLTGGIQEACVQGQWGG